MKKTKLNPKHLYAIFAFLLSAVVVFCGIQIWQEYSSRQKDIDAFSGRIVRKMDSIASSGLLTITFRYRLSPVYLMESSTIGVML